ncbi:hypothetical protein [Paenibacillus fonticola]|uniref:hypothetical protein n=1 Tax=Paenibacillus fonticola TaxID=379896 RepID=UPI0003623F99|nr:hypothetical protein [Paenibacillus fonticola]
MHNPLKELAYISGAWQGEGFILDFTEPVYTLMFGNMQASNEAGMTVYWETFRFEAKNEKLFVYPAQMGHENGAYIGEKQESAEGHAHVFRTFIHKSANIQEIYFNTSHPGKELVMGVRGGNENGPFEKEWKLTKRQ